MKQLSFSILFFLLIAAIHAQTVDTTTAKANLNDAAQKMAQLFAAKNYTDYIKYINPKVISMSGGKDKMIDIIKQALKGIEDQGFSINNVTVDPASNIIVTTKELQSVIAENIELKTTGGKVVSKSYLVATSDDKGKTWQFIDASNKTAEQVRAMFPQVSSKIVIPAKQQPVFYKD